MNLAILLWTCVALDCFSSSATAQQPASTPPMIVKVLVLNYDPKYQGQLLHEVFRWNDPHILAKAYAEDMGRASGGLLRFEIYEWRDLNEIYAREDGGRFTIEEYVRNRRTKSGWPTKIMADYPRIIAEQKVVPMIDDGRVDEVWIFSDHFFGLWEASMAGPGAFFINGGVYPLVPSKRPFAFYGFNYERGVAEMMHNTAHRTEATMNRIYGPWNLKNPKNNWEKFSANNSQSNGVAGVGTCHWPANASHSYDYGNLRQVESWADDFLNYPNLTGRTSRVSVATWSSKSGDHHRNYMKWYFGHLPRAAGTNSDGRLNNWWCYLYDHANYSKVGSPLPPSAMVVRVDSSQPDIEVLIAYQSAAGIMPQTCDVKDATLATGIGENLHPASVQISDSRPGGWRVATYRFPNITPEQLDGAKLRLLPSEVKDRAGVAVPATEWSLARQSGEWVAFSIATGRSTAREIALWAIGQGGKVGISGREALIANSADLPDGDNLTIDRLVLWPLGSNDHTLQAHDMLPLLKLKKTLRTLVLRGHPIGDRGAALISQLDGLVELNLHDCQLTDTAMHSMANLSRLEFLDVGYSHGKISDTGAAALASLTNLRRLNIFASSITDRTLGNVLARLPSLRTVEITSTKVTRVGIATFKRTKTDCQLIGAP